MMSEDIPTSVRDSPSQLYYSHSVLIQSYLLYDVTTRREERGIQIVRLLHPLQFRHLTHHFVHQNKQPGHMTSYEVTVVHNAILGHVQTRETARSIMLAADEIVT